MAAVALDGGRDLLSNGAIPHRLAVTRSRSRLPWSPDPTRIITPLHGIAAAMLSLSFSCSSLRFFFILSDSSLLRPPLVVASCPPLVVVLSVGPCPLSSLAFSTLGNAVPSSHFCNQPSLAVVLSDFYVLYLRFGRAGYQPGEALWITGHVFFAAEGKSLFLFS